ncbi:Nn.00g112590.m01.CDS01 [Neocucurbitaria sp. VM-36]
MSVSDISTLAVSRDNEGSYQLLDGYAYGVGDLAVNSYEKSPYANAQMVSLDVGPDATRFDIHGTVLCQSAELAAKFDPWSLKKEPVPLPELDEATAHTLVHYLYTGKYQALNTHAQSDKAVALSYKLGTCVYCAAVRYKLPGLVELAKDKITSFGEDVSIFDTLAMAREHAFPLLPDEETWYPAYLEGAINSAMAEDPEPFRKPDFITQVEGNSRLLQVVWKTVMSNYARTPVAPVVAEDDAVTPTAESVPEEPAPVDTQESEPTQEPEDASSREPEPVENVASAPEPIEVGPSPKVAVSESDNTQDESLELDDIEPTVETRQAPEPFTDELGFETSKMYKQMGKKSDVPFEAETTLETPKKTTHTRSDSVMQGEESEAKPELERKDSEAAEAEDNSLQVVNGSNDGATPTKKGKKQKKKKSTIVFH